MDNLRNPLLLYIFGVFCNWWLFPVFSDSYSVFLCKGVNHIHNMEHKRYKNNGLQMALNSLHCRATYQFYPDNIRRDLYIYLFIMDQNVHDKNFKQIFL